MKAALIAIVLLGGAGLYLSGREGASLPAKPKASKPKEKPAPSSVTLAWAGDLTPGSQYGLPNGNGKQQLKYVRKFLEKADLTVVNLEGTLTKEGVDKCGGSSGGNCFSFAAPPRYAQGLRWAGIDAISLANNHSMDMGDKGLKETVKAARREGIKTTGLPGQFTYLKTQGLKVALLGFAPYAWSSDLRNLSKAKSMIRAASKKADIVWVVMHAGAEGVDQNSTPKGEEVAFSESRGNTRLFSRQAVKAGADLVTGSGPHVVRGIEWHKGRLIAYSTGNFAGFNNFSLGGALSESAILTVRLARSGRVRQAQWRSLKLAGPGIPESDNKNRSARTANQFGRKDFGRQAALIGPGGKIRRPG